MGDGLGRDGAMLSLGGGGGGRLRLAALAHQTQLSEGPGPTPQNSPASQPTLPLFGEGLLGSSALLACVRDVEDVDEEDSFKENRPPMFTFDPVPVTSYPLEAREIDV